MDQTFKRSADFYDEESEQYSRRRYPPVATDYIQFFFTRRRELVMRLLARALGDRPPRSLLEIGCADGVLLRTIEKRMPAAFEELVGIDISEGMIATAKRITPDPKVSYFVRKEFAPGKEFSVAMEIGVGALALQTEAELASAAAQLKPQGYFVCAFAGRDSVTSLLDKGAARRAQLKTYAEYEAAMRKHFDIRAARSCGFYVPVIWRAPVLARALQPLAEAFFAAFPNLYHERVYLLQKRS